MRCWSNQKDSRIANTAASARRRMKHSHRSLLFGRRTGRYLLLASIVPLIVVHSFAADSPKSSSEDHSTSSAQSVITLKKSARVTSPRITLSQVAEISAPPELVAKIGAIDIGRTPLPGRGRFITRGYIKIRLRAAGIDPDAFIFEGPEAVEVLGPQLQLQPQPRPRSVPDDSLSAPNSSSGSTRELLRGQGGRRAVNEPKKRLIVVRRGEEVFVCASYGLVTVTAMGRALEDGAVGDVIKVQVVRGRRLLARITGPHQAEVISYSQSPP